MSLNILCKGGLGGSVSKHPTLDFGSDHGLSPTSGSVLKAKSAYPSPSLSAPPPRVCMLSLSLSQK